MANAAPRVKGYVYRLFLIYFRFYQFFDNKTGTRHFKGMVPNIFIKKTRILRRMRGIPTIFVRLPVYRLFDNKTGCRHDEGMVPNIFMRKSTILHRMRGPSTAFW